jgi:glucose-6-phosphate 1-dehydrogenase
VRPAFGGRVLFKGDRFVELSSGQPNDAFRADSIVIVGGSGDLSMRMLLPSLYFLDAENRLPDDFSIVAIGHHAPEGDFRDRVKRIIAGRARETGLDDHVWRRFAARLAFLAMDATSAEGAQTLAEALKRSDRVATLFYLATSPRLFVPITQALGNAGLNAAPNRIILEKPVGNDLVSCRIVNDAMAAAFGEARALRIDHYLGKETVQNLIALRFANSFFEPLWNSRAIDHVQITVAETEGIGERWRYYDEYGAVRDMVQNHMLQLLCLVAMEPPTAFAPEAVRIEKEKVLQALRPISGAAVREFAVRGQYGAGIVEGAQVAAYAQECGQASNAETFVAIRADIDNWRWAGTPFYLRTGKRLPSRSTQIIVQFKAVPHSIFDGNTNGALVPNQLLIELQPEEDIRIQLMNKAPGLAGIHLQSLPLSLSLRHAFGAHARRRIAYERLLLDAISGNATLFVGRRETELAWQWIDAIVEGWRADGAVPLPYPAGTWGPGAAVELIGKRGRNWAN